MSTPNPRFFDLVGEVHAMRRLKPDPVPLELLVCGKRDWPFGVPEHERMGIPTEYSVVVTIPIGFPMGRFGPVRREPAEDVTFFERWGETTA